MSTWIVTDAKSGISCFKYNEKAEENHKRGIMPKIVTIVHLHDRYPYGIGNHISLKFLKPLFFQIKSLWLSFLENDQVVVHSDFQLEMVRVQ